MRLENKDCLLSLVRLGIGHHSNSFSANVNWNEIEATAERQGLSAIIVDGIERLPETQRPRKEKLLEMIGQVVQGYEYRYELYRCAIAKLAAFHNSREIKMMVLKGYVCSINWPKPEHRPCGDIDIWQFGKQKEADELIAKEKGIKVDLTIIIQFLYGMTFLLRIIMILSIYIIIGRIKAWRSCLKSWGRMTPILLRYMEREFTYHRPIFMLSFCCAI